MQPVELDALEALLAKASPGEWTASSHDWFALRTHALIICDRPPVFYAESHAAWPDNSTAIAALHNAAPDLIAEARMLRVVRLALERALRERDEANELLRQTTKPLAECINDRDTALAQAAGLREALKKVRANIITASVDMGGHHHYRFGQSGQRETIAAVMKALATPGPTIREIKAGALESLAEHNDEAISRMTSPRAAAQVLRAEAARLRGGGA